MGDKGENSKKTYRSFMAKYRSVMQNEHGWEVELTCPSCHKTAVPEYTGWDPQPAMNFGDTPTIYAELKCPECGADLRRVAGEKLVEIFSDKKTPTENKRAFIWLAAGAVLVLVGTLLPALLTGIPALYLLLLVIPLLIGPSILFLNYHIHSARQHCVCDNPHFIFMGLLGRSSCYRCSNDGTLLRIRD